MQRLMMLLVLFLVLVVSNSFALDSSYYEQFLHTEVFLYTPEQQVLMYVTDVDEQNNVIVGDTNGGIFHVPIEMITLVEKLPDNQHYVHVHD